MDLNTKLEVLPATAQYACDKLALYSVPSLVVPLFNSHSGKVLIKGGGHTDRRRVAHENSRVKTQSLF